MIGRDLHEGINAYRIWPWLAGPAVAGLITALMLGLAAAIS